MAKRRAKPSPEEEAAALAFAQNRSRWPVRLRDLAGAAAFGSMAVSGSIPIWSLVLFGVGLILALFDKRPLAARGTLAAVALAGLAVVLYSSVAAGGLDLVIAACTLAGLITLHRMLSTPTRRTDGQVHLTSMLMIAGGAALSGELLFGLFLTAYAVLASFSVGLSVVEAAIPPGEPLPFRPALRQLTLGALFAVVGAVAFFVLFPRLSWNLAAHRTGPGLGGPATAGFSDRIRMSGDGSIKTNPRVVLRAELTPDPGREQLDSYWVGRTFDTFDGHEWVGHAKPTPAGAFLAVRRGSREGKIIQQKIELLPAYGATSLIALDSPARFGSAIARTANGNVRTGLVQHEGEEVRFETKAISYAYQAYSFPPEREVPDPKALEERERYLQLPENLDPRVSALAKKIVGNERDPMRAARKVEQYLKREYRYSLELANASDPLVSFLFERREGHCEHFATALVILLRSAGVPARAAAGFFGGERMGSSYVVRAGDAHAWGQVLTENAGFVTVDATPDDGRAAQPVALLGWLATQYELVEALWRQRVIDYSIWDQVDLARSLVRPPSEPSSSSSVSSDWRPSSRTLAAVAVFVLLYSVLTRVLRKARPRARTPATAFAERVEAVLKRHGITPGPGEDLETVSARKELDDHPLAAPLRRAVGRYLRARFGGQPMSAAEARELLAELHRVPVSASTSKKAA